MRTTARGQHSLAAHAGAIEGMASIVTYEGRHGDGGRRHGEDGGAETCERRHRAAPGPPRALHTPALTRAQTGCSRRSMCFNDCFEGARLTLCSLAGRPFRTLPSVSRSDALVGSPCCSRLFFRRFESCCARATAQQLPRVSCCPLAAAVCRLGATLAASRPWEPANPSLARSVTTCLSWSSSAFLNQSPRGPNAWTPCSTGLEGPHFRPKPEPRQRAVGILDSIVCPVSFQASIPINWDHLQGRI